MSEATRETILAFLRSIGIVVTEVSLAGTLLPGLGVRDGGLVYDSTQLRFPGDLLHEAGHLAVVPEAERGSLSDELVSRREHAAAEEMAAIAWSYAACVHLGLDPRVVFHGEGYQGGGAHYAEVFERGQGFATPYLQWIGLTTTAEFPKMKRWLRG